MRRAPRPLIALLAVALAATLPAPAAAQSDRTAAPELVAVGTGRTGDRCFVEVHTSSAWPPDPGVGLWSLAINLEVSGGRMEIRAFPSDAEAGYRTRATSPTGRVAIDEEAVDDAVTAFGWTCEKAPATLEVRFDVNDTDGRTLLADAVESHPFVDAAREPGAVPDDELVKDEEGDMLSPDEGGGGAPVERPGGSSMGTGGAIAVVLLVLAMAGLGYFMWKGRDGDDEADY